MSNKVEELKCDLAELKDFLEKSTRAKVKNMLTVEVRRIETELINLNEAESANSTQTTQQSNKPKAASCYDTKIINYGWDQSEKFAKVYVTLPGVHNLPPDQITCTFGPRSFELKALGLDGKNHTLQINNLFAEISPKDSHHKVKTDNLVVFLKKDSPNKWTHITEKDKKVADAKAPKLDPNADPQAGLMSMMQKMYEEGDDEMKRTIAKAWTESRDKNPGMGMF